MYVCVYTFIFTQQIFIADTYIGNMHVYMVRIFKVQAGFLIISHLAS